jgi:ribosomal protein L7/L12
MDLSFLFLRPSAGSSPQSNPLEAVEAKVDLLLASLQIKQTDEAGLPLNVQAALDADHKIQAIKLYREQFNTSLAEAKDVIDAVEHRGTMIDRIERKLDLVLQELGVAMPQSEDQGSGLEAEIKAEIRRGNKISAIKLYREMTGTGLKEAKDAVDEIERHLRDR